MSAIQLQKLTRENLKLKESVRQLNKKISLLENQCQGHRELSGKHSKQRQYYAQQIKQLHRRLQENKYEKQQTQNRYLNVLRKLEEELEDRRSKYHKLETKMEPLFDHDTLRLKILNEVEAVHFLELEEAKRRINNHKDQILKLRRENELYKHQVENMKLEHEDQLRRVRNHMDMNSRDDHLNEVSYQLCLDMENRLRLNYEQARKECDYYKDKYFSCERRHQDKVGSLERELLGLRQNLVTG